MTGSALLLPVAEAESVVGALRARLDVNASLGVPAHVTALFPFAPTDRLDKDTLRLVTEVVSRHRPIAARFSRAARFGDDVLYLPPDDPEPFCALTRDLAAAFPSYPPYGGEYGDPTPHLTVGHGHPREVLNEAERDAVRRLPVEARVERLSVMVEGDDGRWSTLIDLGLGGDER